MRTIRFLTCAGLIAGLSPFVLATQDTPPKEKPTTTTVQVKTTKLMRVGDLVGKTLVTAKNESLGKVEDLVIHPKGEIAFVEFSGTGAMQTGAKRSPVPWRALDLNENGQFVLATTPEAFQKLPGYDKKPNLADMDWWLDADRNFSKLMATRASPTEASASLAPAKLLYLASELRSRPIENPDGEKIATMHELVVDPRVGRIAYAVLAVGGNLGTGEKMIAVPWDALKSMPDKSNSKMERLTLATTKEQLEKAPEFQATSEGWMKATEPDYLLRVYEFYSVPPYWKGETKK